MTEQNVSDDQPTEAEVDAAYDAVKNDSEDRPEPDKAEGDNQEDRSDEVAKLRREAAKYRTERNELRDDAKKWREFQESQKSEMQKLQEANQSYEEKFRQLEQDNIRLAAATKFGVPESHMDLLGSGTQDEVFARAEKLKALMGSDEPKRPAGRKPVEDLRPGAAPRGQEAPADDYPESWMPKSIRG